MAEKRVQQISRVMPKEQLGEFLIYGAPEDVLKHIELLEEVGIQHLIVDLEPYRELEALELFGSSVVKKLSRSANAAH
jgi:hypothetical protein